jgi:[ribosomal protein S5]-alanine N-acetyltransferase
MESNDRIDMQTERLSLRNVRLSDVDHLVEYASDTSIADMMNGSIPQIYNREIATQWISKHAVDLIDSQAISWAITLMDSDVFIGSIQLRRDESNKIARLSYWIAKPYWNRGIATEAGQAVVQCGFEKMQVEKIEAEHFLRNSASKAVLLKLGFQYIGSLRKQEGLFNRLEDFMQYCMTKQDYM